MSGGRLPMRVLTAVAALPFIGFVLFLHGAVPGYSMPAFGQALWILGFAQSFANSSLTSIFATDIGNPAPAAIAFGLPAALTVGGALKLGLDGANAYAVGFAAWLVLAFWGCYRLGRLVGVGRLLSLACAAMWLSTPMLWMHEAYSSLALGMSLLPLYASCAWPIVFSGKPSIHFPALVAAAVISVFMDGYTFVMFAVATGCLWSAGAIRRGESAIASGVRLGLIAVSFATAYVLYTLYVGRSHFDLVPLDFFRAWGANIEFLFRPVLGLLWLSDLSGAAEGRAASNYFGDASVFTTPLSLFLMVAAAIGVVSWRGDKRAMLAFLIIAFIGFYFSLGPSFKFMVTKPADVTGPMMPETYAPIPTGTGFLSLYLPGFDAMRASYRWAALGMFGLWAAFLSSAVGRRSLSGLQLAVAFAVMLCNLPHLAWLDTYTEYRSDMLNVEATASAIDSSFTDGEKVFFAPWGNDFFITYLAPTIGIKTFNIGGDKNLAAAVDQWPAEIQAFPQAFGPSYVDLVTQVLTKKTADAVALSFIDNLAPTQGWPVEQQFKADAMRLADALEANAALSVTRTDSYAIIRLRNN
ncbi:hypothetical protein [Mesorhizobium sp.]|uniref:hypothetical protein n=1 Tax=Mesorhizobium sp. TaxID=1871066 RepID=UPI0025B8E05E|nr:hypothetical protein [Mesorhizobium sp.]